MFPFGREHYSEYNTRSRQLRPYGKQALQYVNMQAYKMNYYITVIKGYRSHASGSGQPEENLGTTVASRHSK
jgi:hypothetical protein